MDDGVEFRGSGHVVSETGSDERGNGRERGDLRKVEGLDGRGRKADDGGVSENDSDLESDLESDLDWDDATDSRGMNRRGSSQRLESYKMVSRPRFATKKVYSLRNNESENEKGEEEEESKFADHKNEDSHSHLEMDSDSDLDVNEGGYRDYLGNIGRRNSLSTTNSYQLYTPDEERAVVRKFDRKLVVFVAGLYMLSFLDRSNIGNAKIAGLERDLHLDSDKYEWVITAFYIAYICFEWMSILWKIVPAHIYVTIIVLSWGTIASLQSIATSFTGLIVLRTLLGIGEAGFTGIPFYLSFFFKREELAFRTGIFLSAAPLATSFASSLAWGIVKLGQHSPIAPWRLLFLVEGFPSVLVAILAWHHIPDSPATAPYLNKREKKIARLRLRHEVTSTSASTRKPKNQKPKSGLKLHEIIQTLLDPKVYLTALMFFFSNMSFSSMPIFLPTILTHMGYSPLTSQALSAPPYLFSFVCVLLTAHLSDKYQTRSPFLIFHALLSSLGYTLLTLPPHFLSPLIRYLAIYLACIGFFSTITMLITWNLNNQTSSSRQGVSFAILQIVGQCGPLVGTRLYPETQAPFYRQGMGVCAGVMAVVALLGGGLRGWLGRENMRLERGEGMEGHGDEEEGRGLVGDGKARERGREFRYML